MTEPLHVPTFEFKPHGDVTVKVSAVVAGTHDGQRSWRGYVELYTPKYGLPLQIASWVSDMTFSAEEDAEIDARQMAARLGIDR